MSRNENEICHLAMVAGANQESRCDLRIQDLIVDGRFAAAWGNKVTIKQDTDRAVHVVTIDGCRYLAKAEHCSSTRKLVAWLKPEATPAGLHHRLSLLRAEGVKVPASIGVLRLTLTSGGDQWVHLMQFLANAHSAHHLLTQAANTSDALLTAIVDQLVVLHRLNRFHGDMKLTNIMVENGTPYLVDVDGRQCRGQRRWRKDLARLLVGFAEVGVPVTSLKELLLQYADRMEQSPDKLLPAVKAVALKIAARHQQVYGRRSAVAEL